MRILIISGSHRKGNTEFLLRGIMEQINSKENRNYKNQLVFINLRDKNVQFVNENDYKCKQTKNCTCCRDDMKDIFQQMQKADVILFGSPVYFSNVSTRMKNLMDRCYPFYMNEKLKGKSAVIVGVGQSQNNIQFFANFTAFIEQMGMQLVKKYYTCALQPNALVKNQHVKKEISQLTKNIVSLNIKHVQNCKENKFQVA